MNSNHPQNATSQDKWQHMSLIIAKHSHDSPARLTQQFRSLSIKRFIVENLMVCLLQYSGLMLTTLLFTPAPIWFASGVAAAFVFMRGFSILPGIWLGSFFAYFFSNSGIVLAFSCAAIHTFQTFLLLWISYRYITPTLVFFRFSVFIKFLFFTSILTALSCFLFVLQCFSKLQHSVAPFLLWMQWWLANLDGILIVSLAIVTWDFYFPEINLMKNTNKKILFYSFGTVLVLSFILVNSATPLLIMLSAVFTLPVIIFISLRYGWCGAVAAMFILGSILSFSAYFNAPLFSAHLPAATMIFIQSLLGVEVIVYCYLTHFNSFE